jgi:DNA-binding beta-propeller fold protein YncE
MIFWTRLLMICLVASCATPPASVQTEAGAADIQWPPPPAQERIRYLYSFSGPADLGIKPSMGRRFLDALAGEKKTAMVRPYAVSVRENLIGVADPGSRAVLIYDLERKTYLEIVAAENLPFVSPVGIALGADEIFVADSSLEKVFVFDPRGGLKRTFSQLRRPTGLAYHSESARLFVAETLGHRIVVFDRAGNRLADIGARGTGQAEFNFPSHISIRGDKLLVNDSMNFQIKTFTLDGKEVSSFGRHGDGSGYLSQPKGIGMDSEGHIYVAGATIDRVQIFSSGGEFLLAFGDEGNAVGRFLMPAGLAIENDLIYVTDSYNGRVQVFKYSSGGG